MSSKNRSNKNHKYTGPKTYEATDGLDDFLRVLEKYFFATAKVKCKHDSIKNRTDLIIDLHHNFGITECLRHFNNGDWGNYNFSDENRSNISNSLSKALDKLNQESSYPTDILELSLHFKDTSMIISRLHRHSIPEHASRILTAVGKHFVYFTKGLTEMPYEIFVPVFEDTSISCPTKMNMETSYYNFWGLYFDKGEQEHEALIYSLQQKKFYEENIFLFE
ncbi:hypothetical protein K1F50_00550 [Muricauda oceani]|uniref:Uncharacterized protein n=1 Tax=Flagellimonas oceani TaxID=2698672 RepID=A0A6G7J237_9FLAO|nr:hypothetical protein [Allomuricauda oceani]MBW8241268.1 hypothetical protein [Allomuricauda oceani]QII44730.1 hypothetical protein GVT53_08560 [Allomuricauda oceani]